MKKSMIFLLLSLAIFTFSACESGQAAQEETLEAEASLNPFVGACEFVSYKVELPDTVITVDQTDRKGLFIMIKAHFTFVGSSPDNKELLFAGRGSYTIDGNTISETNEFHTSPELTGVSKKWEF